MTWNDRTDFEQMLEPLDPIHAQSVEERIIVRREFAAARRRVAAWEPAPFPTRTVTDVRLVSFGPVLDPPVYLDEVERLRPWFRS